MATVFLLGDTNCPVDHQFVYLDTSFVYELHGKAVKPDRQNECWQFAQTVVSKGGLMVVSSKTREELRIMVPAREIDRDKAARKRKIAATLTLLQGAAQTVLAMEGILAKPKKGFAFLEDLADEPQGREVLSVVDAIMMNHGIEYGDAAHYAVAKGSGLWDPGQPIHVATLDGDWFRIPDPLLYLYVDANTYNTSTVPRFRPSRPDQGQTAERRRG